MKSFMNSHRITIRTTKVVGDYKKDKKGKIFTKLDESETERHSPDLQGASYDIILERLDSIF